MTRAGDHAYRFALSTASLLMAQHLAEADPDEQRSTRKHTVAHRKWSLLRDTFPADLGQLHGYGGTGPAMRQLTDALAAATRDWPAEQRWLLLIDLLLADPYAPYALRVTVGDVREAITAIAGAVDIGDEHAGLLDAWHETLRSYGPSRWKTVIAPSALSTSALVTSGPDPATASALAAAAGSDGDGATARDAIMLGGGSLALGGAHFAGGTWLVATTPDARDTGADGDVRVVSGDDAGAPDDSGFPPGARLLCRLGPARARVELVKLQLNFRLVVRYDRSDTLTDDDVAHGLARIADDLQAQLELERLVNDDDAPRITDIEAILRDVAAARRVADEVAAAA